MNTKDRILKDLRESISKREKVARPKLPTFEKKGTDLRERFKENLVNAAGTWFEVNTIEEAQEKMKELLPDARVICSATPEWVGNKTLAEVERPQDLQDVDLGVIRAPWAIAETGGVWLTEDDLQINALGCLSEHLAILLDPNAITENMHTAYKKAKIPHHKYGLMMMGPSATGDIQATIVRGAQGARTLTLFFLKENSSSTSDT